MDPIVQERINEWLSPEYDELTRREIQTLLDRNDEKELTDRFYTELEFGTAGLRGTLGAGSNRMNIYVVRKATQGLANIIIHKNAQNRGVLVGRDSRIKSDEFAKEAVGVLIANGIKVFYFDDIHPTPTVSFGVRELNAIAGVMITASHNPKEYNGYKVVWEDGGQIVPPVDKEIISEVRKIKSLSQVKHIPFDKAKESNLFKIVDREIDSVYLNKVKSLSIHPEVISKSEIKICYSPLYGTGYKLIPESLKNYGFKNIEIVKEQATPDGNFPGVPYPNPEVPEAMESGIKIAQSINADLFIATDPDADRMGTALRKDDGSFILLNGNQIAAVLGYYILSELRNTKRMPKNPRLIKSIVTTEVLRKITEYYNVALDEVLTGFKWIGAKMNEYEKAGINFVFGCEESHGYLAGTFVRDKDAVIASSLLAEAAAFYKTKGISLYQILENIYKTFGYYKESQQSITMKGKDGLKDMKDIMEKLRNSPPERIENYETIEVIDLYNQKAFDVKNKKTLPARGLPVSDVVILKLSSNAKIVARPSGTEPKIKFYFTTCGDTKNTSETLQDVINIVEKEHRRLKDAFLEKLNLSK